MMSVHTFVIMIAKVTAVTAIKEVTGVSIMRVITYLSEITKVAAVTTIKEVTVVSMMGLG